MSEEYGADLISVVDDDGKEHSFELLDAIETDDGRYVALMPVFDDPSESIEDDGELIILEVIEENGEETLAPIESDEMFDNIASIFEERLSEFFEIEEIKPETEE